MIQPEHVLPSNAPPLRDDGRLFQVSRVLQEQSGNRQQSEFVLDHDVGEIKGEATSFDENQVVAPLQRLQSFPPLYHPQPQHRQAWRYGYARAGWRYPGPEEEARIRLEAERLYNRVRKSQHYLKYRDRQTKDDKGNQDQKWPEHLEKAFFRGS